MRVFLFARGFEMGKVDQTLFLLRWGKDILIVQVYVDDIVFGGSSNSLVARFAEDMSWEFEMSMMGELHFFLGLQIKQSKEGTFVHQAKCTKEIVRKFKMEDSKAMATPMSTTTALDVDEEGGHVDQKEYRSMIGSLLYLTATRPDIQFSVCMCARFQASPRTSHRQAVKRIFRYLGHTPDFILWYSASCSLALHGFSDADFARCRLDKKSTSGTCQFLGSCLVSWSSRK
jgi:spore germination protein GerM